MSRKLVLVGAFLAVLPLIMISAKAWGADPPKKMPADDAQPLDDADNPFGRADQAQPPQAGLPRARRTVDHPIADSGVAKRSPSKPASNAKTDHTQSMGQQSLPKLHGGEKAILKALKQKTSIEFVEAPLKEVLDFLSEKHRIPIRMDSSALKEAGVDGSTPITCKLSGISLRSALEIMLDEIQLKWTIHHDLLMITSPSRAESDEYMYTKCYDVTDLLATAKDFEFQNPLSPCGELQGEPAYGQGPGPSGPYGMGMGGPASSRMWPAYNFQPIQDAITNIVATKTWVENGGTGTISEHDRMLVINQTREVHMAIEQFLDTLRTRRRAAPTLSVELHWLWLDPKQRGCLLAARVKPSQGQKTPCVDPQRLQQVAREARGFHGRVSCVNGLGTVLAAGDRRLLITGAIPVVGGPGGDNVGYTPMTSLPNVGVTARIRPTFVPGTKTANLDIVSLITRWDPARKPALIGASWTADKRAIANNSAPLPAAVPAVKSNAAVGGSASCPVDRPVVPTQQISTTLRVPLGKPVIVGSMTFDPAGGAGLGEAQEGAIEVYLIATTSIVREAKR